LSQTVPRLQVIVVDNASVDGTAALVRENFPQCELIESQINRGVAGGRNLGVEHAKGEICVFIDDDAIFESTDAISKVVAAFQALPTLACAAFTVLDREGKQEEHAGIPRADKKSLPGSYDAAYFCGAGFALRTAVFRRVGGFWEPLFYIGEELDLAYRMLNQGFTIRRLGNVRVWHAPSSSARPKGRQLYYTMRNRYLIAVRNLPLSNVLSWAVVWWGAGLVWAIRQRSLRLGFSGIAASLSMTPTAIATRTVIDRKTVHKVRALSGRLWY
jgi:GT2 family glycosyltransferase